MYENPEKLTEHNLIYPALMLIAVLMKMKYQSDKALALAQLIIFSILWGISLILIFIGYFKKNSIID